MLVIVIRIIPVAIGKGEENMVDIKSMPEYTVSIDEKELPLNLLSKG
jgi:hypothetical protein